MNTQQDINNAVIDPLTHATDDDLSFLYECIGHADYAQRMHNPVELKKALQMIGARFLEINKRYHAEDAPAYCEENEADAKYTQQMERGE